MELRDTMFKWNLCARTGRRIPAAVIPCTLGFFGCFNSGQVLYEEILSHPSAGWSDQQCFTVIAIPAVHNHFDVETNVKVMAVPYYPSVIIAIQRSAQHLAHWSEGTFRANTDTLMADAAGMYVDWRHDERITDPRGNYLHDSRQIDVLEFLVTIDNTQWPCPMYQANIGSPGSPTYVMAPVIPLSTCSTPDISHLEKNVFLENDLGDILMPRFVWGRRNDILTMEETVFVKFHLRASGDHFLKNSQNMRLVLRGFDKEIRLSFPLSFMR